MTYLSNTAAFEAERKRWRGVIDERATFPKQVFKQPVGPFMFFEFGLLFTSRFFQCVKSLLVHTKSMKGSFVVLEPDPVTYFYKEFRKYPVVSFSAEDTAEAYLAQLSADPGNGSADSIASNSERVLLTPASLSWQMYGERKTDWVVFNCMSKEVHLWMSQHAGLLGLRDVEEVVPFLRDLITVRSDKGLQFDGVESLVTNYSNRR